MLRRLSRERFLTDAELTRLLAVVRSRRHKNQARDHCLLALLANTGIRPSEALALTRADVHPHARPPWIRVRRLKKRTAVPHYSELEIPRRLAALLRLYMATFPERDRLFQLTRRQAQRRFRTYSSLAGIHSSRSLYVLRHTAASRFYRITNDIHFVQALLGHENASTSSIYAHVPRERLRELSLSLPAFV